MFTEVKRLIKISQVKTRKKDVYFGKGANIGLGAEFKGQNKIGSRTWFEGVLGFGSYIGDDGVISARIGKFCSIGHKVSVLTGTHPSHVFVSTHPVFYSLVCQNGTTYVSEQKFQEKKYVDDVRHIGCDIGNDVWIGYNVTIMGGCTIGDGAIVASGALVNKDVEPYTIVAGQPAKVIGKRFNDDQIKWLQEFRWWDKDIDWIRKNANMFENIEQFMDMNSTD